MDFNFLMNIITLLDLKFGGWEAYNVDDSVWHRHAEYIM
jgi:hypothetical protein